MNALLVKPPWWGDEDEHLRRHQAVCVFRSSWLTNALADLIVVADEPLNDIKAVALLTRRIQSVAWLTHLADAQDALYENKRPSVVVAEARTKVRAILRRLDQLDDTLLTVGIDAANADPDERLS